MAIKVFYKLYRDPKEYSESVTLQTKEGLTRLIHQHACDTKMYLKNTASNYSIPIVDKGLVITNVYNNKDLIVNLLNNPEQIPEFEVLIDE